MNEAYSNFFHQIRAVTDNIASCKTKKVKANTGDVLENMNTRDKLFERFKNYRLYINKEMYKKSKIQHIKINHTKKALFNDKLQNIFENQELREALKSLRMPEKTLISNFNAVERNNTLTLANIFKYIFSNLAVSLSIKLPNAPNKYKLESIFQYYSKFIIEKPFHLSDTSEEEVFT